MEFGLTAVPAIAVICYVAAEAAKATSLDRKWLPVLCMVLGGVLGAVALYVMPGFSDGNLISAVAIGIASGASATSLHQTQKQLARCELEKTQCCDK